MDAIAERQETRIATWGNSDGIRIPKSIMRRGGLSVGDKVGVFVNRRGNIEIERAAPNSNHRKIRPANGISFNSLFKGYVPTNTPVTDNFPEDMVGVEAGAWCE